MENLFREIFIGAQLVHIDDTIITVRKNGKKYKIEFEVNEGDCCGYADIVSNLYYDMSDTSRNPIVTNIQVAYDEDVKGFDDYDGFGDNRIKITLLGEYAPLVDISAIAGSGSGWDYGACVTLVCKKLKIRESIV